jgi:hypothetical protein
MTRAQRRRANTAFALMMLACWLMLAHAMWW